MKVLLIQQDMGIRESVYQALPIGLTYIAASLRDYAVKIFDPNILPIDRVYNELNSLIVEFSPDIIGISIRNIDTTNYRNRHVHFKTVGPMVRYIRKIAPRVQIFAGGAGFSLFPEAIMHAIPEIDFGVYLEGEESTPELIAHINSPDTVKGIFIRENNSVRFTGERKLPDFSLIPEPCMDPTVIDLTPYRSPSYNTIGIQSKRGCALKCAYCSYPLVNGEHLRLRDPVSVVDQIAYMREHHGVTRFTFVDSVFNLPLHHAVAICEELISRKLNVQFGVWCHLRGITEEFLHLLKAAGAVQVDFSPDAATDKGLSALRKGITTADITRVIHMARKVKGVGFGFGFFTSLPGYSFVDMFKTLIMPFRIQLALLGRGGGGISYVRIEPNTIIRDIAVKDGLIQEDDSLLPKDEDDLSRMFFRPPSQRHLNLFTDIFLGFYERGLKPAAIRIFRIFSRIRRKKSVYDQKAGFVPFQKFRKS